MTATSEGRGGPIRRVDAFSRALELDWGQSLDLGTIALDPGRAWYLPLAHQPPDGALAAPQPVRNLPNAPVSALNESSLGPGMWVEVTVPYVDLVIANPPGRSPWTARSSWR